VGLRVAGFKSFEDIDAWKKARELSNGVYSASRHGTFSRDFGLCDQIRRASVSVMSNIAEGFERHGEKEFLYFLSIAKGSAGEVRCQLYIARDQNYIDEETFRRLSHMAIETSRMIAGLMTYLRSTVNANLSPKRSK